MWLWKNLKKSGEAKWMKLTKEQMIKLMQNTEARKAAMELMDLVMEEAENHSNSLKLFYEVVMDRIPSEYKPDPVIVSSKAMDETEARAFDKEIMEFGKHKGASMGEIPLDYLLWLEEQPNFRKQLNRYLRSKYVMGQSN